MVIQFELISKERPVALNHPAIIQRTESKQKLKNVLIFGKKNQCLENSQLLKSDKYPQKHGRS